jgi:ubiquinone/menaquinone biosynthesis C-methylase UbiE
MQCVAAPALILIEPRPRHVSHADGCPLPAPRLPASHRPAHAFDRVAPTFDRQRPLPSGVAEAVRAAIIAAIAPARPLRHLDLGAGTGRFGSAFLAAGDDYVGADLSTGMLREFAARAAQNDRTAQLVQADGASLPFRDGTFDTVLLMNVFGGLRDWQALATEARRVLRPDGAVIVGRTSAPPDGLDARMKRRAKEIISMSGIAFDDANTRDDVVAWLNAHAARRADVIAARWSANRTPRDFIERHGTGARFSGLPQAIRAEALRELGDWAAKTFGSLDTVSAEQHALELGIFTFQHGAAA